MNRVSRKKNENFTIISNVFLRDKELSIKAKGFLAVVMGLPDNWEFTINGICQVLKEGKTSIYNVINELKDKGYCKTETCRNEKGVILGVDYSFFEEPNNDNPCSEKPYTENPSMDNQPQLNTYINNDIKDKELTKEEDKSSKKDDNIDYSLLKSKWEEINPNLSSIRLINDKRKRAIKTLLKNNNASTDDLIKAFKIISISSFCQGSKGWKATFDWLINDTKSCFNRLLEGDYCQGNDEMNKYSDIMKGIELSDTKENDNLIINGTEYK